MLPGARLVACKLARLNHQDPRSHLTANKVPNSRERSRFRGIEESDRTIEVRQEGRGFYWTRKMAGAPAHYEHCASRKQCKLIDRILAKKIMDNQANLKSVNSVKEVPSSKAGHVSLGRDRHVRQVTPDRHLATVRNKIKIGIWNVRTL
ncbi:hypothetical protein ElyMa_002151300 [Elysia marginata]|uniref:Uncharacterized protein n=1 Tax=Elysia marginata TaxID=1093978 RepID=A0AAV4FLU7_9GAST|nr:hypothetical protein ElyMa_002151300 [Elysia marginata]